MIFVSSACAEKFHLCGKISDWTQRLYIFVKELYILVENSTFCVEKSLIAIFPVEKITNITSNFPCVIGSPVSQNMR